MERDVQLLMRFKAQILYHYDSSILRTEEIFSTYFPYSRKKVAILIASFCLWNLLKKIKILTLERRHHNSFIIISFDHRRKNTVCREGQKESWNYVL
jgi:hypothetical protein